MTQFLLGVLVLMASVIIVVFAFALANAFVINLIERGAPWRFSKRGES